MFFSFFQNLNLLGFWVGDRAKNSPKLEKIISHTLHISETIHHDYSWQKMAQNEEKICLSHLILGTIYHMIFIYGTHV